MSLTSLGLPGTNSTVSIYNQNVTVSSLATFGEANLSVLTYPRNNQLCIQEIWIFRLTISRRLMEDSLYQTPHVQTL